MPRVSACPDRTRYQALASGQVASAEKEALLEHLEQCSPCGQVVEGLLRADTLVEEIRQAQTVGDDASREKIAGLIQRLSKIGPAAAAPFACPACGKTLKIPPGSAGKKVRCPLCHEVIQAPLPPAQGEDLTPAPASMDPLQSECLPQGDLRPAPAGPQGSTDNTLAVQTDEQDLVGFLAPAQGPDELGRLGHYRVLQVLGHGGMGVVYLAEEPALRRKVALKAMLPALAARASNRQRFLREAQTAAALEHDHIVPIYYVGEDRGVPFIAMPLLKGESLEARIKSQPVLPIAEVLRIGRQTARGLAAAHAQGLVHRDIKPANLWLEGDEGRVKILDFGLARATGGDTSLTQTGEMLGTPAYMAPEQAQGLPVDHSCDLFSLGVVLYRMSAGQQPFRGENTLSILFALASEQPRPLQEVNPIIPAGLAELVMQLLSKDPALRPGSAKEVAERLQVLEGQLAGPPATGGAPPRVPPAGAQTPAPRRAGPPKRWLVAAAVLLAALLPLSYFMGGMVVRFATNKGQVVIETNDPGLEVTVKENGAVIQDRPGQRVITVAAGKHELEVLVKDAAGEMRLFTRELTLSRGGKQVLSIQEELAKAAAPVAQPAAGATDKPPASDPDRPFVLLQPGGVRKADREKPFVLVRKGGEPVECGTFTRAVQMFKEGDVIEVHGNGPFRVGKHSLESGLHLKAAPGYRPLFLPAVSETSPHEAWFWARKGTLTVEGCDFRGPNVSIIFRGGDSSWEFRSCRFLGHSMPAVYSGPQLRFTSCLLAYPLGGSTFVAPTQLFTIPEGTSGFELDSCVVWASTDHEVYTHVAALFAVGDQLKEKAADCHILLRNNTVVSPGRLLPYVAHPKNLKLTIEAEGNVFQLDSGRGNIVVPAQSWKEAVRWQGKNNLYANRTLMFSGDQAPDKPERGDKDIQSGLAAWNKLWGREEPGSREVPWVYPAWDEPLFQAGKPEKLLDFYRRQLTRLQAPQGPVAFPVGPDWDVVGPGPGYVRALAAQGKEVSREQLRLAPVEGTPLVLLRQGKVVGRFDGLGDVYAAAQDGDVIEIRTDDPIRGQRLEGAGKAPKSLTLRGAPGYRAVIEGKLEFAEAQLFLTLENLHIQEGSVLGRITDFSNLANRDLGKEQFNYLVRLANCSLGPKIYWNEYTGRSPHYGVHGFALQGPDGRPGEIVRCILPCPLSLWLAPSSRLQVSHCVVGGGTIVLKDGTSGEVHLVRSVVWHTDNIGGGAFRGLDRGCKLTVTSQQTLFHLFGQWAGLANMNLKLAGWKGSQNVYCIGDQCWLRCLKGQLADTDLETFGPGLAEWRALWKSDEDSVELEPVTYDPLQWKLVPGSPGSRAGPDSKDLGADVRRIGTPRELSAKDCQDSPARQKGVKGSGPSGEEELAIDESTTHPGQSSPENRGK